MNKNSKFDKIVNLQAFLTFKIPIESQKMTNLK